MTQSGTETSNDAIAATVDRQFKPSTIAISMLGEPPRVWAVAERAGIQPLCAQGLHRTIFQVTARDQARTEACRRAGIQLHVIGFLRVVAGMTDLRLLSTIVRQQK